MGPIEVLLVLALIVVLLCININRLLGLPPGPVPWPLVGNTFQLPYSDIDKCFYELKKTYGDVFTLWIPFPTVIISSHEALKRTIIKDGEAYSGRPTTYIMDIFFKGNYGLFFEENDWYKSQRRFTLHTLRNLGVGKDTIKAAITTLIHRTEDELRKTNGEPVELRPYLSNAVGNVINQLAFGYVRPSDDKTIEQIQKDIAKGGEVFNDPKILLLDALPFLRHLDSVLGFGLKSAKQDSDKVLAVIKEEFDRHKKTIDYNQEPTNYIDCYLHEIHRREKEGTLDEFTEWQCMIAIFDLYTAGMETIITTLRFAFHYLLNNPLLQEKMHREIDEAIGRERDITMDDQKILPYTCAFLQEVYRVGYVLFINLLRITTKDVNCEGYNLRPGTRVMPQYASVHMDEAIYPRPELVIPERHLKDGQFIKDERITGFSVGKRSCLGENLARMEVFMFFASLMQKFRFEPEGIYPPKLVLPASSVRAPLKYKIRIIEREL